MRGRRTIVTFLSLAGLLLALGGNAQTTTTTEGFQFPTLIPPNPVIKIPGLSDFSTQDVTVSTDPNICPEISKNIGGCIFIPWIGQYLAGIYRFAVVASTILAVVVMMVAGFLWLTAAGNVTQISTAKTYIGGALLGLFLMLGSYTILNLINPALVEFKSLRLPVVKRIEMTFEESGDSEANVDATAYTAPDVYCPQQGGPEAISKIITSLDGKVYYRFGAKGGKPPYQEIPTGPYATFNNSCPEDGLCFDCSGFVNYVLRCAGMAAPGGGTSTIFSGADAITSSSADDLTVNGQALKPGDLLGWKAGETAKVGHVYLYLGDGKLVESHGGVSGRERGSLVVGSISDSFLSRVKWIRRP